MFDMLLYALTLLFNPKERQKWHSHLRNKKHDSCSR